MNPSVNTNMGPGQPGTINYVKGQVSIDSQPLNPNAAGQASLQAGQTLNTQNGRAEVLLTPGVMLRIDNNSSVVMNSPGIANTILTLQRGRAFIEADEVLPANNIVIQVGSASVRLEKRGLYELDATSGRIRTFDGQAAVQVNARSIEVKGGHELALNVSGKLKAREFDKKGGEDEFYRWASLRSAYLAEANINVAQQYVAGGPYWYGAGWYWDPWYDAYTWLPGDGIFWSPFGWGFYSPWMVGYAPFFGFGYGYGIYHRFGPGYHPPAALARGLGNGYRGGSMARGFSGGGFAGGMRGGFGGGGFHGGGGGRR
ncbi:MAG TPA: hypothetical protein VK419_12655 [Bryobacteraceae bacterium]|nr:hypothetical protein [Bryobacteraceae bacterium]